MWKGEGGGTPGEMKRFLSRVQEVDWETGRKMGSRAGSWGSRLGKNCYHDFLAL